MSTVLEGLQFSGYRLWFDSPLARLSGGLQFSRVYSSWATDFGFDNADFWGLESAGLQFSEIYSSRATDFAFDNPDFWVQFSGYRFCV